MIKKFKTIFKNQIKARLIPGFNWSGVPFALARHYKGKSGLAVIDVGAHEGLFTEGIDRLFGIQKGILVELQPSKIDNLRRRFPSPRFKVVNAAVSNVIGAMDVEINTIDSTTSILKTKRKSRELAALDVGIASICRCPIVTLDSIICNESMNIIDLLKVDVQGAEHLVISGAAKTLSLTAAIWIEVSFKPLYEGSCMYNEVFDLLWKCGFKLWDLETGFRSSTGELVQADALFLR